VTTEDDFQAALDAKPDDWQTRLVFADWLQERNDPRAEGYRALGQNRLVPKLPNQVNKPGYTTRAWAEGYKWTDGWLPNDWFPLARAHTSERAWTQWAVNKSRREAEDMAALAFAQLPPERRAELLAGVTDTEPKEGEKPTKPKTRKSKKKK
jgi:uncharacterized protein (TIGR02996 family)